MFADEQSSIQESCDLGQSQAILIEPVYFDERIDSDSLNNGIVLAR